MKKRGVYYYFGIATQLGTLMAANVIVAFGFYKLITLLTGDNVFLLLIFVFLGTASGIYSIYKMLF